MSKIDDGAYRIDSFIGKTISDFVHYEKRDSVFIEFTDGTEIEIDEASMWVNGNKVNDGKII